MRRIICFVAVCLFFSAPALAADLTRAEVLSFLSALEEMKSAGAGFEEEMNTRATQKAPDPERPFARVVEIIGEVGFDEAAGIVEQNGFNSLEDWGGTGDRIMAGVRANAMRQSLPAMNAQIEQMLAMLEQNPNVTEAQRAEIMKQLETAKQLSGPTVQPPTADEQLVEEMQAEIEAAFQ